MKKIILFFTLLSIPTYAQEQEKEKGNIQLKLGAESTKRTIGTAGGVINLYYFDLTSWSVHIEKPVWKEVGIGFGLRKEEAYAYDGYYVDLYVRNRYKIPDSILYLHTAGGFTLGLPSREYDFYDGNHWVFLKQDLRSVTPNKILVFHPTVSIGVEVPIYKGISLEPGVGLSFMTFGFKSVEPPVDEYRNWAIPTYRIRLVFNFDRKPKN